MRMFLRRYRFQFIMIAAISILLVASILIASFAWLEEYVDKSHYFVTTSVTVNPHIFFTQTGGYTVEGSKYQDNGYYVVNLDDPSAENYAAKMQIRINFKGVTYSYLRVYLGEMWLVSDSLVGNSEDVVFLKPETDFGFTANWFDNRYYDNFIYYRGNSDAGIGVVYGSNENETRTLEMITGIRSFEKVEGGKLYMEIRVEAVQINRLYAFWGMNKLPYMT